MSAPPYDPWPDMVALHNTAIEQNDLLFWTIYDHPEDMPDWFVVRPHSTKQKGPLCWAGTCSHIEPLRERLMRLGLTCMVRDPSDPPSVVECWF